MEDKKDKAENNSNTKENTYSLDVLKKLLSIIALLTPVYLVSVILSSVDILLNNHDPIQFSVYNYMLTTVSYTFTVTCYLSKNRNNNNKYTYARNILLGLSFSFSFLLFFNIHLKYTTPLYWLEILVSIICTILLFIVGWYLIDEGKHPKKKRNKNDNKSDEEDSKRQEVIKKNANEATSYNDGTKNLNL